MLRVTRRQGDVTHVDYRSGRRDVTIHAPAAAARSEFALRAMASAAEQGLRNVPLFDRNRMQVDQAELQAEALANPEAVQAHCPLHCTGGTIEACEAEAMEWWTFLAHLPDCINRWQDIRTPKTFQGVSLL